MIFRFGVAWGDFLIITNKVKGLELSGESVSSSYILTNKKGGFYFGSLSNTFSKFNGLFFPYTVDKQTNEWDMVKTVESLGVDLPVDEVVNNLGYISLKKGVVKENYFLNHSDTLVYEVNNFVGDITLNLDCKRIYDDTNTGRIYKVSKSKGCTVFCYEKFKSESLIESNYKFYVAIKSDSTIKLVDKWFEKNYSFDEQRGEHSAKWVYNALQFSVKGNSKVVVSYSIKKSEAVKKALEIFENEVYIRRMKVKYCNSLSKTELKLSDDTLIAYKNAVCSFDNLICDVNGEKGIYAGLPWFFQFWARDEAISLGALIKEGEYILVKNIIFRWLKNSFNGRVGNRFPNSELGSADATGWIFFRLMELLKASKTAGVFKEIFTRKDLNHIYSECFDRLNEIESNYLKKGLIYSEALETWMDTGAEVGDLREGFNIEIQALHVAMYNCLIYSGTLLRKNISFFETSKNNLISCIRENFYNGKVLFDQTNSSAIRPNLFIAAYVAPEILKYREWQICFDVALESLFVDGRILTIPETDDLFVGVHSGINNHSYHRGDTWYWLDNMVAIVLTRFGKSKYKSYVEQIKLSSVKSLLYEGSVGSFAEVSSALVKKSEGCLSQAWSYALFIELLNT